MPLQNRVLPNGDIVAQDWRGAFMGNRGGRIHSVPERRLGKRRWASKRWICCVTAFKNRQRTVMGEGYTELFFLDEASALASGHRPCFECRRQDARRFAACWAAAFGLPAAPSADAMDRQLHAERLAGKPALAADGEQTLPDGAMTSSGGSHFLLIAGKRHEWSPKGYSRVPGPPSGETVLLLTPPSVVSVLKAGYVPQWHASAGGAAHGSA